jgi:hypothetical protein
MGPFRSSGLRVAALHSRCCPASFAQRPVAVLNPPLPLLHRRVSVTVGGGVQHGRTCYFFICERRQTRERPCYPGSIVKSEHRRIDAPALEALPDDMISDNPILSAPLFKIYYTPKLPEGRRRKEKDAAEAETGRARKTSGGVARSPYRTTI